jgi:hypothetical protein
MHIGFVVCDKKSRAPMTVANVNNYGWIKCIFFWGSDLKIKSFRKNMIEVLNVTI